MKIVLKKLATFHKRPFWAAIVCNAIENKVYYVALIQLVLAIIWALIVTSYRPDYQAAAKVANLCRNISIMWLPIGIILLIKSLVEWQLFLEHEKQHNR